MFYERLQAVCEMRNIAPTSAVRAVAGSAGPMDGWKNKGSMPRSDILARLADYLNTSTDYLLGRIDDPSPLTKEPEKLNDEEEHLIKALRTANPAIRSTVFRMIDAALLPQSEDAAKKHDNFFDLNDEIFRHKRRGVRARGLKRVEGEAAAGMPFTTVPDGERMVSVPAKYLADDYFIVQARGDSMIDANINSGDYCVFQKDAFVYDGQIMYVQVDGGTDSPDGLIKRVFRVGDRIELRSENSAYQPMVYPASEVQLLGALVLIVT